MFLPLLSSNTERTNNTFQLFEYSKTQVNGLILLLESILWKGGYLLPLTHTHTCISAHFPSCCSHIIVSHVDGLAVMKCEASVTPQGSYRVELYSLF